MQGAAILARNTVKKGRNRQNDDVSSFLLPTNGELPNAEREKKKYSNFWAAISNTLSIQSEPIRKLPGSNITGNGSTFAELSPKVNYGIIHPNNPIKLIWDAVVGLLVIYSIIAIPYRIATHYEPPVNSGVYNLDLLILAVFCADIVVNFNTAYFDEQSESFVSDRLLIAHKYLFSWFILDLVSAVPFDVIVSNLSQSNSIHAHLRVLRELRILRLARLAKIFKSKHFYDNLEHMNIDPLLVNMLSLTICIAFFAHIVACIWLFIGRYNIPFYSRTWITIFTGGDSLPLVDCPRDEQYTNALYWTIVTMLTVGYGDIRATNAPERVFAIITMLSGGIIFGALISKVTKLLEKRNPQDKAFTEKLNELRSYLENFAIPISIKNKTKDAYSYYFRKKSSFSETGILEDMPAPMMTKLIFSTYENEINRVKLFHTYHEDFVINLVRFARPFECLKSEIVLSVGDISKDIFFICTGVIRLSSHDGNREVVSGFATEGGYFGDFEYYRRSTCIATYIAATHCEVLAVSFNVISRAVTDNFESGAQFQAELKRRYSNFIKASKAAVVKDKDKHKSVTNKLKVALTRIKINKAISPKKGGQIASRHNIWLDGDIRDSSVAQSFSQLLYTKSESAGLSYRVITTDTDGKELLEELTLKSIRSVYIFHPRDPIKLRWDVFIAFLIIITVMVLPVELCFVNIPKDTDSVFNWVVAIFFMMDIVLSFRTAYEDINANAFVIVPTRVCSHYIGSWFLIDVLSGVPIDSLLQTLFVSFSSNSLASIKLLKIFRFARLLKFFRLLNIQKYLNKIENLTGVSPALFDMFKLFVEVFIIAHLIACCFWGISSVISKTRWYNVVDQSYGDEIVTEDFQHGSLASQYLISLYFTFTTLTTVGYGDITPINMEEKILTVVVVVIGASVFGYVISNVSALVDGLNHRDYQATMRLSEITQYLQEKKVAKSLSKDILDHFRHYFKNSTAFSEDEILARLPPSLSNQIRLYQHHDKMVQIHIFRYIKNESVSLFIFQQMDVSYVSKNKYLIKQGKESNGIMFIITGLAKIIRRKPKIRQNEDHYQANENDKLSRNYKSATIKKRGGRGSVRIKATDNVVAELHKLTTRLRKGSFNALSTKSKSEKVRKVSDPVADITRALSSLPPIEINNSSKPENDESIKESIVIGLLSTASNDHTNRTSNGDKSIGFPLMNKSNDNNNNVAVTHKSFSLYSSSNSRSRVFLDSVKEERPYGTLDTEASDDLDNNNNSSNEVRPFLADDTNDIDSIPYSGNSTNRSKQFSDNGECKIDYSHNNDNINKSVMTNTSNVKNMIQNDTHHVFMLKNDHNNLNVLKNDRDDLEVYDHTMSITEGVLVSDAAAIAVDATLTLFAKSQSKFKSSFNMIKESQQNQNIHDNNINNNNDNNNNDNNKITTDVSLFSTENDKSNVHEEKIEEGNNLSSLNPDLLLNAGLIRKNAYNNNNSNYNNNNINININNSLDRLDNPSDDSYGERAQEMRRYLSWVNNHGQEKGPLHNTSEDSDAPPIINYNQNNHNYNNNNSTLSKPTIKLHSNLSKTIFSGGNYNQPEKVIEFCKWTAEDMDAYGYESLGELKSGDFIGHVGLMERTLNAVSARAMNPMMIYTLSKVTIGRLLNRSPEIAMQLQNALALAIAHQRNHLGKFSMRRKRALFIQSLVSRFTSTKQQIKKKPQLKQSVLRMNFDYKNNDNSLTVGKFSHFITRNILRKNNVNVNPFDNNNDNNNNNNDNSVHRRQSDKISGLSIKNSGNGGSLSPSKRLSMRVNSISKKRGRLGHGLLTVQQIFYDSDEEKEKKQREEDKLHQLHQAALIMSRAAAAAAVVANNNISNNKPNKFKNIALKAVQKNNEQSSEVVIPSIPPPPIIIPIATTTTTTTFKNNLKNMANKIPFNHTVNLIKDNMKSKDIAHRQSLFGFKFRKSTDLESKKNFLVKTPSYSDILSMKGYRYDDENLTGQLLSFTSTNNYINTATTATGSDMISEINDYSLDT
eukprot:gene11450-15340_t